MVLEHQSVTELSVHEVDALGIEALPDREQVSAIQMPMQPVPLDPQIQPVPVDTEA